MVATWLSHVVHYAVPDAEATKLLINKFIFKQREEGVIDDIIYKKTKFVKIFKKRQPVLRRKELFCSVTNIIYYNNYLIY